MKRWHRWALGAGVTVVAVTALTLQPLTAEVQHAMVTASCLQHGQLTCPSSDATTDLGGPVGGSQVTGVRPDILDDVTAGVNQVVQTLRDEGQLPR